MKQRHFVLSVDNDPDMPSPNDHFEDCSWTLYSFCQRHTHFKHPEQLGLSLESDDDGLPIVEDLSLKSMFESGLAFFVSYYEHGNCMWFLKGDDPPGVEFRWDGVRIAGILKWEYREDHIGSDTMEGRITDARIFLENYTNWANGESVCYSLQEDSGDFVDSGSLYSLQDAIEMVDEELQCKDQFEGWPIVVRGGLANAVESYHPIEGHSYVKHHELQDLPQPEYEI